MEILHISLPNLAISCTIYLHTFLRHLPVYCVSVYWAVLVFATKSAKLVILQVKNWISMEILHLSLPNLAISCTIYLHTFINHSVRFVSLCCVVPGSGWGRSDSLGMYNILETKNITCTGLCIEARAEDTVFRTLVTGDGSIQLSNSVQPCLFSYVRVWICPV